MKLVARGRTLDFPRRPLVMGIVNLSADSFSGDGVPDLDDAISKARQFVADGAEIIDIGAESARTNRGPISEQEEIDRLCPFVAKWQEPELLSINTWRPAVARAVLSIGGHFLNDIGGLATDENARICAECGSALVIMHSVGEPKVPHTHVDYDDVLAQMEAFFAAKLVLATTAGLPKGAIVLDPGIDFAKQRSDNIRIYQELSRFLKFDRPVLVPVSRKTVIGEVLGIPNAADRDSGTIACLVQSMLSGANIFRVHNVRAAVQAIRIIEAVENATVR